MASSLGGLRRYRDALKILGESLQLYWNLTDDQCPLRIRLLAYSHMNRSAYLAELGHHGGALESSEISVDLYRKLVQNASEPAHIHRYFAISLVGMASSLNKVGRYKDAMDAYTESISIYRNPFQGDPAQLSSELASSLEGLAWSLHKLEDHQAALSHVEEGLQLLPRSGKGRIRSACLKTRAVCLSHLNRHQQAKKAFLDSMDILRSLHGEKPEEYVSFMAEYALEYSRILLRKGDSDEAKTTAKESVSRYRLLARDEDSVYNSGLKEALEHLSNIQAEEARKTLEESFKFN
ncbi:hypothetical protein FRC02_006696 [Tulasnella sp. 418]|nr:hypothetical protein FRC02_006696 [Tulasnella sp. 418]